MATTTPTKSPSPSPPHRARPTRLVESSTATLARSQVDRERGLIRGVKILGAKSRNGRVYTPAALASAVALLEGTKVNINHSSRKELVDPDRRLGKLQNVRLQDDGVYGDLSYLRSHPIADRLCEAAETNPDLFGLSINADGESLPDKPDGHLLVTRIVAVKSVDLVSDPATVSSLFESQEPIMDPLNDAAVLDPAIPVASPEDAVADAFKAKITAILDDDSLPVADKKKQIAAIVQALDDAQSALEDAEEGAPAATEAQEAARPTPPSTGTQMVLEAMAEKGYPVPSDPGKAKALLESLAKLPTKADVVALLESTSPQRPPAAVNRPRTGHSTLLESERPGVVGKPLPVDVNSNEAVAGFLLGY